MGSLSVTLLSKTPKTNSKTVTQNHMNSTTQFSYNCAVTFPPKCFITFLTLQTCLGPWRAFIKESKDSSRDVRRVQYTYVHRVGNYMTLYMSKHTRYMMAKVQIFKMHTYSCPHKHNKCYSSSTYQLKCHGCDLLKTGQIQQIKVRFCLSMSWRHIQGAGVQLDSNFCGRRTAVAKYTPWPLLSW